MTLFVMVYPTLVSYSVQMRKLVTVLNKMSIYTPELGKLVTRSKAKRISTNIVG